MINKDIIYLDSNSIGVSDNEGNIKKRTYENNIEDILAKENKVEIINEIVCDLKKDIEDRKGLAYFCKNYLRFQPIVYIIVNVLVIALGSPVIETLSISTLLMSILCSTVAIVKRNNKKKLNGSTAELKLAEQFQEDYQNDLEISLIKNKELAKAPEEKLLLNEIVSIAHSKGLDESVMNELNEVYNEAYYAKEERPFTRTRKKNNKKTG